MNRFRGGLVFNKAHRLVYHSTLGLRVIKKKKEEGLYRGVLLLSRHVGGHAPLPLSLSYSLCWDHSRSITDFPQDLRDLIKVEWEYSISMSWRGCTEGFSFSVDMSVATRHTRFRAKPARERALNIYMDVPISKFV